MRTFHDAKAMAKTLRAVMADKNVALSHSECLEIVAHQFGFENWNVLSARIVDHAGADADVPTRPDVHLDSAIPIVRIFSVDKAMEFYVDFLGFTLEWEHRFEPGLPLYAQVSRSGLTLHLSEHHGDASPGSNVFVRMTGIDSFHRELLAKKYSYGRPGIEEAPWDARVLNVHDPFGNSLRFSEANSEQ
ncbi:glyoxalase superfamily protein [Phytoactinopolyspora limicola]|uniref:glyoxalase superfamily protein n=1 Tax=Phytoactinopolyspora limicola TaxID=2715536 RepID=UPI00140D6751|nr:glyoxalase superfamily protein [Phytoactinopolyspora limicola]